jgi:hypothetical protein
MSHPAATLQAMHHVPVIAAPPKSGRACWHCVHFSRMVCAGSAAWCNLPMAPRVQAGPADGCSAWERVPGVDDEEGPPAPLQAHQASAVRPVVLRVAAVEWAP